MFKYKAPKEEYLFLKDVYGYRFDDYDFFLNKAASLAEETYFPLTQIFYNWKISPSHKQKIKFPEEFISAFNEYARDGWAGLDRSELYGGSGGLFSETVTLNEFLSSGHLGLQHLGMLTRGAVTVLKKQPQRLKNYYLAKLVTGDWSQLMHSQKCKVAQILH